MDIKFVSDIIKNYHLTGNGYKVNYKEAHKILNAFINNPSGCL
jgi:hypothetical protein